jgi:ribosomal protein S18 acetylase RimI-like enzyme
VDESFRRKGYGLQIMRAVLSSVNKKYNHAILHVTKENFIAVALYQKLGFIITDSVLVYEI